MCFFTFSFYIFNFQFHHPPHSTSTLAYMQYKHLFFDLDHTLWDFDANARHTLQQLHTDLQLQDRGVHDFEVFYTVYLEHNHRLWDRYRKGFIKQEELRIKRMWLTLLHFKIADEALCKKLSNQFLELLPTRTLLFPHTKEVLQYLQDKGYGLHMITNGFEQVQHSKLRSCGLNPFFEHVITSEGSGSLKPEKEIFEYALQKAGAAAHTSLMIGDTWEVDIVGAMAAGIDAVFVNHTGAPQPGKATYSINNLKALQSFL